MPTLSRKPLKLVSSLFLAGALLGTACGPKAVRGENVAGLDDEAMGTGLDRRDLERMLHENMQALQSAAVVKRWEGENRPAVAVLPLRNETSEHIDSSLDALISDIETTLVNAGHVRVISLEQQPALMQQAKQQNAQGFDAANATQFGKQIGARYIVTGKVFNNDERQDGERRVQYFMFIQVLDVETSDILFQNKTTVTKALL